MKILLVTDAWKPQVNGVVRTLTKTVEECEKAGHVVEVIAPSDGYFTLPLPTYKEIRIALFAKRDVERRLVMFGPDAVHIATEGPLGQAARALCLKWGMPFTTSYHTKFPEYVNARFPFIPTQLVYKFVREFHNSGGQVMVTTPSMVEFLEKKEFNNLVPWARGVDLTQFRPDIRFNQGDEFGPDVYEGLERPIFVNVGRIAVEKNIEAFLKLDLPGSKVIVGEGPQLSELKRKYASERVKFVGAKFDQELARYFSDADVFVFPSRTDTFGLVIIEAMATGTPVAGFPVHGPIDIIPGSKAGVVDDDLQKACLVCLELNRDNAATHAKNYAWEKVAEDFVSYLVPETEPQRRLRWRRARRALKLAGAPWRIFKKGVRRVGRFVKTGR
ncbi:MAG: glycosyltransferase family 1 protein [Acidimicrobiales bacterium]|nr:glycosyltransferase family 1 protein [Hyphomonadaceae bacterium]RZV42457.1 MAG: glycosyltransferase family 1 protein [Acidimicrobiales bacterium]